MPRLNYAFNEAQYPATEELNDFVDHAVRLQNNKQSWGAIASFFYTFTNKVEQHIKNFYGTGLPTSFNELQEIVNEVIAYYAAPLNVALQNNSDANQHEIVHVFMGIANNLYKATLTEDSPQMIERYFANMRNNLSILISRTVTDAEKKFGGFFQAPLSEILTNENRQRFFLSQYKYKINEKCFAFKRQDYDQDWKLAVDFLTLNKSFFQDSLIYIVENDFNTQLYFTAFLRLWGAFLQDNRCPEFIKDSGISVSELELIIPARLKNMIFYYHLEEVIFSSKVMDINSIFAQTIEAVCILWRYPENFAQENDLLTANIASLDDNVSAFRRAVIYMLDRVEDVKAIHEKYHNLMKEHPLYFGYKEHRCEMLGKIIPDFLLATDNIVCVSRIFNRGSVKILESLATSEFAFKSASNVLTEMRQKIQGYNLETRLIASAKEILLDLISDFSHLFPVNTLENIYKKKYLARVSQQELNDWVGEMASSLLLCQFFHLDNYFIEKDRKCRLNYCFVMVLANNIVANFLCKKFSGTNVYQVMKEKIGEIFTETDDQSYVYAALLPNRNDLGFTTFVDIIFHRFENMIETDKTTVSEMFYLQPYVTSAFFCEAVTNRLISIANSSEDHNKKQERINEFIEELNSISQVTFTDVIKSIICDRGNSSDVERLFSFLVDNLIVLNLACVYLQDAACQSDHVFVSQLVALYVSSKEQSNSLSCSLVENLPSAFRLSDDVMHEEFLRSIFISSSVKYKNDFLKIIDSSLSLYCKLKLIGHIAQGRESHGFKKLSFSRPLYKKLTVFSRMSNNNEISSTFDIFLENFNESKNKAVRQDCNSIENIQNIIGGEALACIFKQARCDISRPQKILRKFIVDYSDTIKSFNDVLIIRIDMTLSKNVTLALESLQKIYLAHLQDWHERKDMLSVEMPMKYPVVFLDKNSAECIEIHVTKDGSVLSNRCSIHASYLLRRASRSVADDDNSCLGVVLNEVQRQSGLSSTQLSLKFDVAFFDQTLVLIRQVTYWMLDLYVNGAPLSRAYVGADEFFDDPVALSRCSSDDMIGLFVLACMFETLRENEERSTITQEDAMDWLNYLLSFAYNRLNVQALGAPNGIRTSSVLREAPRGLITGDKTMVPEFTALADALPYLEQEGKTRQQAYCLWFRSITQGEESHRVEQQQCTITAAPPVILR